MMMMMFIMMILVYKLVMSDKYENIDGSDKKMMTITNNHNINIYTQRIETVTL